MDTIEKLRELAEELHKVGKLNFLDVGFNAYIPDAPIKFRYSMTTHYNEMFHTFDTFEELKDYVDKITHKNNEILFRRF